MTKTKSIQRGFFGGEIDPDMFGHVDKVQFQNGCALMQNMLALPQGAAAARPGWRFVRSSKNSSKKSILLPFIYSKSQAFAVEVGEGYFRFHTAAGTLLSSEGSAPSYRLSNNITALTASEIGGHNMTVTGHNFVVGDPVEVSNGSADSISGITPGATYYVLPSPVLDASRAAFTNNAGSCQVNHGAAYVYSVGDAVRIGGSISGTGISLSVTYYVHTVVSANAFLISLEPGTGPGTEVAFVAAGGIGSIYRMDDLDPNKLRLATKPDSDTAISIPIAWNGTPRIHYAYKAGDTVLRGGVDTYQCLADHPLDVVPESGMGYWVRINDGEVYEIPNFYLEDELYDLDWDQVGDVLTITHENHSAAELRRLSATAWSFGSAVLGPEIGPPTSFNGSVSYGLAYDCQVTANATGTVPAVIQIDTGGRIPEASLLGFSEGAAIRTWGYSSPAGCLLTDSSVEYVITKGNSGANSRFEFGQIQDKLFPFLSSQVGALGTTYYNGRLQLLSQVGGDEDLVYVITSVDSRGVESLPSAEVALTNNLYAQGASNTLQWSQVVGAVAYRIYRQERGVFALVAQVNSNVGASVLGTFTYKDDGAISPDSGRRPPEQDDSIRGGEHPVSFSTTITESHVIWGGNQLRNGDAVVFSTDDTLPTGITAGVTYYVIERNEVQFRLAAEPQSQVAIKLSGSPSGINRVRFGARPRCTGHFSGRRLFAVTEDHPQRFWATRSNSNVDISYTIPPQANDRIQADLNAVTGIRRIVAADHLLLLTDDDEHRVTPINTDALTPDSFDARAQSWVGCGSAKPVFLGGGILFSAARGGHVFEMGFQASTQGFVSGDVSLRAAHLFDNLEPYSLAASKAPHPVAWASSSSGMMLGLTYLPREGIGAWTRHTTAGTIEWVCAIPDGEEDHVYAMIKRTINGQVVRNIERLDDWKPATAIADEFHVDCGSTYSGSATTLIRNLTHLDGEAVVGLADGVEFSGAVVAQPEQAATFASGGSTVTVVGHGFVVGELVTVHDDGVNTLPGELADGSAYFVESTPTADTFTLEHAVGSGAISYAAGTWAGDVKGSGRLTLETAASTVQVGLAYTAMLQTLPFSAQMEAYGMGRTKSPTKAWVRVTDSGSFKVGPSLTVNEPIDIDGIATGVQRRAIPTGWSEDGQVMIIQDRPLPLTVVSMVCDVELGG